MPPDDVGLADALLAGLAQYEREQRLAAEHRERLLAAASVATGIPADEIRGMVRDPDWRRPRGEHGRAHRVPRPRSRARAARRPSGARRAAARAPAGSDSPSRPDLAERVRVLEAALAVLDLLERESVVA